MGGESAEAQMGLDDFFKSSPHVGKGEIGTDFVRTYRFFPNLLGKALLKEKENITMILNVNLFLVTLFLLFGAGAFVYAAWQKKEEPRNTIGDLVCAYCMACAIVLIWR